MGNRAISKGLAALACALACAGAFGCSSKKNDATSVVVLINSHDFAPGDITGVNVDISIKKTKRINLAVADTWPVKFVLVPARDPHETFNLDVHGYKDDPSTTVIASGVTSEFSPNQVGFVEIWLDKACVGVACPAAEQVCVAGSCDNNRKQPFRKWLGDALPDAAPPEGDGGAPPPDAAVPCEGSETTCDGNTPVSCVAGFQVREAECAGRCDAGICVGECRAGQKKCEGRNQYDCLEGRWAKAATCPFSCQDGACVGECATGERKCIGNGTSVCDGKTNMFVEERMCSAMCVGGFCTGECTPAEIRCNGKTPWICQPDKSWKPSDQCSYVCDPSAPQGCTGVCDPGSRRCGTNKVIETCTEAGVWSDMPATCAFTCRDDTCAGVCSPGEKRCSGRKALVCGDDGNWAPPVDCPFACINSICSGVCVPGSKRCSDDLSATQVCDAEGMWKDVTACDNRCNPASVTCNACPIGKSECTGADNNESRSCGADGTWTAAMTCSTGCTEGSCNSCTEGQSRCTQDGDAQGCGAGGQWGVVTGCMKKGCIAGKCNQCVPNTQRCGDGKIFKCSAQGVEDGGTACAGGQSCNGDGRQCNACTPNSKTCSGNGYVSCSADGLSSTITPCTHGCNTAAGGQAQCNVCAANEPRCPVGTKMRHVCNSTGTAETTTTCANNQACAPDGKSCAVCETSGYKCESGGSRYCSPDRLTTSLTPCASGCNNANGQCFGCQPGSTTCSNGTLLTCRQDGSGRDASACASCNANGINCNICTPNSLKCNGGKLEKCQGGLSWVVQETCGANGCNDAGYCNQCASGTAKCESSTQIKRCVQGKWENPATCPNACVSDATLGAACGGVCKPGTSRCPAGGSALLTCNSTGTAETSSTCPYGAVCESSGAACKTCADSSRWCMGSYQYYCSPFGNAWDTTALCENGCDADQQPYANCFPCKKNSTQCDGRNIQTCTDGYTYTTTMMCPYGCTAGECTGNCVPGSEGCVSNTEMVVCGASGWFDHSKIYYCPNADCWDGGICQ